MDADTGQYFRGCLLLPADYFYRYSLYVLLQPAVQYSSGVGRQQDPFLVPAVFYGAEHPVGFVVYRRPEMGSGGSSHRYGFLARGIGCAVLFIYVPEIRDSADDTCRPAFPSGTGPTIDLYRCAMGLQFSITAIGSIMLQSSNNALGTACVAAFTAAMRIKMFFLCMLESLGIAMATYCGQNYGAGKPLRIWQGVKVASGMMVVYVLLVNLILWTSSEKFALLFVDPAETEIIADTALFLHVSASFFPLLGLLCILRYSIQGAGYTRLAMFSGVSEMIARILVSLVAVPMWGFWAVCFGDPTAWVFADLFLIPAFIYVYRRLCGIVVRETNS